MGERGRERGQNGDLHNGQVVTIGNRDRGREGTRDGMGERGRERGGQNGDLHNGQVVTIGNRERGERGDERRHGREREREGAER